MESDANIPCSKCLLWDKVKKSFSCDPNRCKKLSDWLLKHATDNAAEPQKKMVQYVV
jgi:hypothetical protein